VQNSDFLAVGCGLNDSSCLSLDFVVLVLSEAVLSETVLSETVLVLDGCLNCGGLSTTEYDKSAKQRLPRRWLRVKRFFNANDVLC